MNIELKEISVRDLTNGYKDNAEDGVIGYQGKLDIRPPYQREFVYGDISEKAISIAVKRIQDADGNFTQ